jgi:hypothetical protein
MDLVVDEREIAMKAPTLTPEGAVDVTKRVLAEPGCGATLAQLGWDRSIQCERLSHRYQKRFLPVCSNWRYFSTFSPKRMRVDMDRHRKTNVKTPLS